MKTWIILDLLVHLSAGKPWLDFTIPKPRRCLYVDEEMNQRTLVRRLKRLALGAGIDLVNLPLVAMNQQGFRMNPTGGKDLLSALRLVKGLEGWDPEVVVTEALVRVLVGNENEAKDVAEFWRHSQGIVEGGKRTFIGTHHLTKPGDPNLPQRTEDNRTRGSGDILAGCDAHFSLTRQLTHGHLGHVTTVKFWKSREGEERAEFQVMVKDLGPHEGCLHGAHVCPASVVRVVKSSKPQGSGSLYQVPLVDPV